MIEKDELRGLVAGLLNKLSCREFIVAGNWKMNMTLVQASAFLDEFPSCSGERRVMLFPPATLLLPLSGRLREKGILYGPQNIHHRPAGAFTGEISIPMIREAGCGAALIGHSERRRIFGETDADIHLKATALLEAGIIPVICIGETLEEREAGRWREVLEKQICGALEGLVPAEQPHMILAYEPVWAIGTGLTASPQEIREAHRHIKQLLESYFKTSLPVLYGGSVNESSAAPLGEILDVDGFLVGGASLDAASFSQIIKCSPNRHIPIK